MAYGALANGGLLMQPRLVREIRDADGRVVERFTPQVVRRVVDESVARSVSRILVDVVQDGTGTAAGLGVFKVAGKTGTSRTYDTEKGYGGGYFASFVGFFPAEDPQLVVFVKLEDPKGAYYGGAVAAPVTRATMEAALAARATPLDREKLLETVPREMQAPPALPVSFAARRIDPPAPPEYGPSFVADLGAEPGAHADRPMGADALGDGGATDMSAAETTADGTALEEVPAGGAVGVPLPDVAGLPARTAVRRLHGLGFRVRQEGAGPIEATFPAAGTRLQPGDTVVLVVARRSND
jgi:membrane peptidoglycan carboxypeptidase